MRRAPPPNWGVNLALSRASNPGRISWGLSLDRPILTSATTTDLDFEQLVIDDIFARPNHVAVVVDTDTVVHWTSPNAKQYGFDCVGQPIGELIHPEDRGFAIQAFDAEVLAEGWEPSEMAKGTLTLRLMTPSGYVAFEVGGSWAHKNGAKTWFVVTLTDVGAQHGRSVALRALASGADVRESARAVAAAAHGYGGVCGAQMVWVSSDVVQTEGDLGTDVRVVEDAWPTSGENDEPTVLTVPPASDWCYGFPLRSGNERLGTLILWGVGKAPMLRFATSVVEPLLDLASLVVIRSRELSNLNHRATTDHVTGLLNRHAFFSELDQMVERSAVIYVDLDGFKAVNDQFGHTVGDRLLLAVAQRLSAAVNDGDSVGRLGGDEFAIACFGVAETEVRGAAEAVSRALNQTITIDGHDIASGASVGVAYSENSTCGKQLIDAADQALLFAKAQGKGGVHMVTIQRDAQNA